MQNLGSLKIFRANLRDEGSFDEAVAGCDYVFYVAAPVILNANDHENELIKPAVQGILNVMKSCLKANSVKRFVLTSSAAAVSIKQPTKNNLMLDEESWSDMEFLTDNKLPTCAYGVSKMLTERREALRFAQENNITLVTMIPALTIGPALASSQFCRKHRHRHGPVLANSFGELPERAKLSLSSEKLIKAGFKFKYGNLKKSTIKLSNMPWPQDCWHRNEA